MPPPRTPLVVVTVGTDHHLFGRLVGWMDEWAATSPGVRCVIQHGASPAPVHAEGLPIVPRAVMLELMSQATVVVAQAGPGSILDARSVGLVPIVVPRLARLDEVVDDHQVAFADVMRRRGDVVVAHERDQLVGHLTRALAEPALLRRPPAPSPAPVTAAALSEAIDETATRPPGRFAVRRALSLLRPPSAAR